MYTEGGVETHTRKTLKGVCISDPTHTSHKLSTSADPHNHHCGVTLPAIPITFTRLLYLYLAIPIVTVVGSGNHI